MQLNLLSGESLKAVMSGAQSTVLPKALIDYLENDVPKSAWVTLAGVTAVTLLAGSEHDARVVTGITLLNTDDAAITVTLTHVTSSGTNTLDAKTLAALDKLEIRNQTTVTDSSGNVKLGFQSTTTTFTGDVTLSAGSDVTFSGTTGQSKIKMPDNLASALQICEGATSYFDFVTTDAGELIKADQNMTVKTGKTLAVTDADKATIGGVIVPQDEIFTVSIPLHATKTIYNLFTARTALQVLAIDYTPDIAQGGALTATVVKATGTATPASATTPMHIAGAIDLNAAAHTVQSITLTVTGADLQLAAGNRIGLVLSGAMTVGSGNVTIRMKRI